MALLVHLQARKAQQEKLNEMTRVFNRVVIHKHGRSIKLGVLSEILAEYALELGHKPSDMTPQLCKRVYLAYYGQSAI